MMDILETFRMHRATIPLSFLQILDLYTVPTGFYESLNEENRMCELSARFPKSGHIYDSVAVLVYKATPSHTLVSGHSKSLKRMRAGGLSGH